MEKVLVTGGSGYIAQHCIAELLKKGYLVKTSLRSENREAEVRQAIAKGEITPEQGNARLARLQNNKK